MNSGFRLRVDEETKARWEAAAAARRCSVAELVREAVEALLGIPDQVGRARTGKPKPASAAAPSGNLATKFRPDFKTGTKK